MSMQPELPSEKNPEQLENYFLLFKSYHGALLGWCIRTGLATDEIIHHIESAAKEWLLSEQGKSYVQEEKLEEWGVDYANAMMNIPPEILAKHNIFSWTPIYEILELDADENLLPDELRAA